MLNYSIEANREQLRTRPKCSSVIRDFSAFFSYTVGTDGALMRKNASIDFLNHLETAFYAKKGTGDLQSLGNSAIIGICRK